MATTADRLTFDPTDDDFDPNRLHFIRATDIDAYQERHIKYVLDHARCDQCGELADTVHILPSASEPRSVELCCEQHDAGGYWTPLREWFGFNCPDDWSRPGYKYTTRQHLWVTKSRGAMGVALVEERLQFWGE